MSNERLKDIFAQFDRYILVDARILNILDALSDVHDNLENGMADEVIAESVDRTRRLLDEVLPGRTRPTVLGPRRLKESTVMIHPKTQDELNRLAEDNVAALQRGIAAMQPLLATTPRDNLDAGSALDDLADAAEELQARPASD